MSLKQFFLTLAVCAALIQVGLKCAHAEPPYEVTLEDEFGNQLPTYPHRGQLYAMGRDGQRYNVRVTNRTGRRIEAVVSVDGRDVLSGQPGDFKHQRGYLVPAYGSVLIEGFRTSLSEVAAFRFTSPDNSYSARMGTPENVGVIGAAFFPEAAPRPVPQIPRYDPAPNEGYREYRRGGSSGMGSTGPAPRPAQKQGRSRSAEPASPAAESAPSADYGSGSMRADSYEDSTSNIGTEYGEQRYNEVSEVAFTRARPHNPDRIVMLRYDDHEGLVARGVLPRPRPVRPRYTGPSPFPVNGFAPPPPPRSYWN